MLDENKLYTLLKQFEARINALEDKLYEIMDKEGFIQSDKLEGPQGSEDGLQVNNQVGQAASIADELSNPMNNVEPGEDMANGQEAMPAPTME